MGSGGRQQCQLTDQKTGNVVGEVSFEISQVRHPIPPNHAACTGCRALRQPTDQLPCLPLNPQCRINVAMHRKGVACKGPHRVHMSLQGGGMTGGGMGGGMMGGNQQVCLTSECKLSFQRRCTFRECARSLALSALPPFRKSVRMSLLPRSASAAWSPPA